MKPKKTCRRLHRPKSSNTTQTKPGLFLIDPPLEASRGGLVAAPDWDAQKPKTEFTEIGVEV